MKSFARQVLVVFLPGLILGTALVLWVVFGPSGTAHIQKLRGDLEVIEKMADEKMTGQIRVRS